MTEIEDCENREADDDEDCIDVCLCQFELIPGEEELSEGVVIEPFAVGGEFQGQVFNLGGVIDYWGRDFRVGVITRRILY